MASFAVRGTLAALALVACHKESPAPTPSPGSGSAIPTGSAGSATAVTPTPKLPDEPGAWYQAKLVYEGIGDLPFFLHLPPQGKKGHAFVVNGDEIADFTAEWRDNEINVTSPWNYTSLIEAEKKPDGKLEGTWTRDTPLWGQVVRTFIAVPITAPDPLTRFPAGAAAAVNVAGTWHFQFAEHGDSKGKFEQGSDGIVRGFLRPGQLGDIRFLAGNMRGTKLSVSTFNGNAANLVLADVSPDGKTMTGIMSMQNVWNEKFTAQKDDDYKFVNKVHLKDGKQTVSLKGLDKYKGKPTLAIIFATWCSSCNDAWPHIVKMFETYHPQGLEVYSVAYDLSDDVKNNLAQLATFRDKYKIPWQMIQVPCTPETWAKAMPQELDGWDGLPIIMLVKPDGTIQTVFGGWFGPATGAEGERLRAWFEDETKHLLASAKKT